jgi:hypothetical protein
MSADIDFERRVRSELRSTLDHADGPHPDWATSPAAAIVAADPARSRRTLPWRLLAVAAVLVVGSVAAVILASPEDQDDAGIPGCPTLADYAAASAQPSPVLGQVPEVSFPPVAPTATMTTGLLQPGDWAVMTNADGPGLQIRVRDVRACGRLPDLRSSNPGGSIYLATVDVRFVRDTGMGWLGVQNLLEGAIGGRQGPTHVSGGLRGIPGVDSRTWANPWEGFAVSGTYILDVPATDEQIAVDHPTPNTDNLPGVEVNDLDSPRARWVLREGAAGGDGPSREPFATPGATPTTGQVEPGQDVTFRASGGMGVLRLSDIDEVAAYPGLQPEPGNVFVEVLMTTRQLTGPFVDSRDLHALDAEGRELPIVQDALDADRRVGVLPNLLNEAGSDTAWIVIEAPATGPIRLEYRHEGNAGQTFWIQLRD